MRVLDIGPRHGVGDVTCPGDQVPFVPLRQAENRHARGLQLGLQIIRGTAHRKGDFLALTRQFG